MTHPSPAPDHPLHAHYDALWRESLAAMRANGVTADPHLADKASDGRRGLTVLGRPDAATRDAVQALLEELAAISPSVYRYHPNELHVTVLSLPERQAQCLPTAQLAVFAYLPHCVSRLRQCLHRTRAEQMQGGSGAKRVPRPGRPLCDELAHDEGFEQPLGQQPLEPDRPTGLTAHRIAEAGAARLRNSHYRPGHLLR